MFKNGFRFRFFPMGRGLACQARSVLGRKGHFVRTATTYLACGLTMWLYLDSEREKDKGPKSFRGLRRMVVGCAASKGPEDELQKRLINPLEGFDSKRERIVQLVGEQGPLKDVHLGRDDASVRISALAAQVNANNPIEDRLIIQRMRMRLPDGRSEELVVSAVIDGHGGWQVAEYVQRNFLRIFRDELCSYLDALKTEKKEPGDGASMAETDLIAGILYSLKKTYHVLDEELRGRLEIAYNLGFSKLASVGACTTVSVVTKDAILTANSGDCLSVFCGGNGVWLPMNEQLSAMNPVEQKRLEEAHPHEKDTLIQCKEILQEKFLMGLYTLPKFRGCYVKGILQPSRAIGDFRLKNMDFNYNWEKDLSTEKLLPTFSHILKQSESGEADENELPYSYELINGPKSISLRRDSSRYFVKDPMSFPYVRSDPMLHLYFYGSSGKRLESTQKTLVEKISPTEYSLTLKIPKLPLGGSSLKVSQVIPEYRHLSLSNSANSAEFARDFTVSKLRNICSYFQDSVLHSKKNFLVLGTDGVWDFLTPKDVSSILLNSRSPRDGLRSILKSVLNKAGVESMEKLKSLPKKRKVFDDTSVVLLEINSD
ncbi:protein phosphatase 2C domain-containing protein [Cryptosporidium felis]|nr:protein phosphatase 2C domain-containing protein [Cryptosporidium felis]